jgi:hypothetical protein
MDGIPKIPRRFMRYRLRTLLVLPLRSQPAGVGDLAGADSEAFCGAARRARF